VPSTAISVFSLVAAGDSHSNRPGELGHRRCLGRQFPRANQRAARTGRRSRHRCRAQPQSCFADQWNSRGMAGIQCLRSGLSPWQPYQLRSPSLPGICTALHCSPTGRSAWGDNTFGQTNVPIGVSNVVAIAAGDFHTFALRADGRIVGWVTIPSDRLTCRLVSRTPSMSFRGTTRLGTHSGCSHVTDGHERFFAIDHPVAWVWVLQWAPTPGGPYTDVVCSGRCYTTLTRALRRSSSDCGVDPGAGGCQRDCSGQEPAAGSATAKMCDCRPVFSNGNPCSPNPPRDGCPRSEGSLARIVVTKCVKTSFSIANRQSATPLRACSRNRSRKLDATLTPRSLRRRITAPCQPGSAFIPFRRDKSSQRAKRLWQSRKTSSRGRAW